MGETMSRSGPRAAISALLVLTPCVTISIARASAAQDDVPAFARERPEVRSGDPILKFNGRDLAGFTTYLKDSKHEDPRKVFSVVDGMIRITGEEWGALTTAEEYSDYHLIVEWKWGERTWPPREKAARDSGILLHCVGPEGAAGGQWMQSVECQIIEGGCGDFILVGGEGKPKLTVETRTEADGQLHYEKGGTPVRRDSGRFNWWGRDPRWRDELGFRGARDVEKPAGEWNTIEVICDGGTITNIVNGLVVNVGTESSQTHGKIQFQSEGAEILFRRIEIRPLAAR
jgi:hypothetical protein